MEEIIDLIATDASASEVSDKIKDALFAKSSERIEGIKPNVASTVFDDINPEEPTEQEEE
tara:strand:+ start:485 stop:664 length:180 start_codon:yes stop_codon:yes gene_type:complete